MTMMNEPPLSPPDEDEYEHKDEDGSDRPIYTDADERMHDNGVELRDGYER